MYPRFKFKQEFSFEQRLQESSQVLFQYSDRIPLICEKAPNQTDCPNIERKYLIPNYISIGQFIYVIRTRMNIRPEEAIFLFVNNQILSGGSIIKQVYNLHKDLDGFLYVQYSKENIFG